MALTKGWLYLPYVDGVGGGSEMQVPVKDFRYDVKDKPMFTDYSSDGHYGFSTKVYQRIVKIKHLMFDNKTDYDLFKATLDTLQAGAAYNLRYKVKSTGEWEKFDGVNQTMPVLFVNQKGLGKSTFGDDQHYEIKMLTLRQAGALTT